MKVTYIWLISLLSLSSLCNEGVEEVKFTPKSERQLSLLGLGVAAAGFGGAYLGSRYIMNSNKMVSWENDKDWEKRFIQTYLKDLKSKKFLNLIIDNLATSISNNCMIVFKKLYEPGLFELNRQAEQLVANNPANLIEQQESIKQQRANLENELFTNFVFCDDLYEYVTTHGHLTKYIVDVNYMLFYFKNSALKNPKFTEDVLGENFLRVLTKSFEDLDIFKKIQEIHKKYMYITINYFLDEELEVKKVKKQKE